MKLILFVLFCTIFSVQSKIRSLSKTRLIKAGDPVTLWCDRPSAIWKLGAKIVADCGNCPSSACVIGEAFKGHVIASCHETNSSIRFKSTQISNKGLLKCSNDETDAFQFLVGSYDNHLRSENKYSFALDRNSYTLICDKEESASIKLYSQQGEELSHFDYECNNLYPFHDTKRLDTCDVKEKKGRFHMKVVTLKEDGDIYGCESGGKLSLYRLRVNAAVISVSIKQKSKTLIENKEGIFICEVKRSKPEASFQWITLDQDGKEDIQMEFNISKTHDGKLWQTTSYLKLKLNRTYQKIKCRARIEHMPWKDSSYQLLYIKYPPKEVSTTQTSYIEGQKTSDNPVSSTRKPNVTYLSTPDHPNNIAVYVVPAIIMILFIILFIIGGILLVKHKRSKETQGFNNPSYNVGSPDELEFCSKIAVPQCSAHKREYVDTIPRSSAHRCEYADTFPHNSIHEQSREPIYSEIYDIPNRSLEPEYIHPVPQNSVHEQSFEPIYSENYDIPNRSLEPEYIHPVPQNSGSKYHGVPQNSVHEQSFEPIYSENYDIPNRNLEPEYIHPVPQNSGSKYHGVPQNSDSLYENPDSNYENASNPQIIAGHLNYGESRT